MPLWAAPEHCERRWFKFKFKCRVRLGFTNHVLLLFGGPVIPYSAEMMKADGLFAKDLHVPHIPSIAELEITHGI